MPTPAPGQKAICRMRLDEGLGPILSPRDCPSQREDISDKNRPHQPKVTLRNGPGPKRAESCATDTTSPKPSTLLQAEG
jgi:hypothetical protein